MRRIPGIISLLLILITVDLHAQQRASNTDEYRVARMIKRMLCITGADGGKIEGTGILAFQDIMKRESLNAGLPDEDASFNKWWEANYTGIACTPSLEAAPGTIKISEPLPLLPHIVNNKPYADLSNYDDFFKGAMKLNINIKDGTTGKTLVDWLEEMENKAAENGLLNELKYYREVREYFIDHYGARSGADL